MAEVLQAKPFDFNPKAYVTAAYVVAEGKFLFMQHSSQKKYEPLKWGVPAGKKELCEMPEEAVKRELFEETGIKKACILSLQAMEQLFIRKPQIDYIYHGFKIEIESCSPVLLSYEHIDYKWLSINDAYELKLMAGAGEALAFYFK